MAITCNWYLLPLEEVIHDIVFYKRHHRWEAEFIKGEKINSEFALYGVPDNGQSRLLLLFEDESTRNNYISRLKREPYTKNIRIDTEINTFDKELVDKHLWSRQMIKSSTGSNNSYDIRYGLRISDRERCSLWVSFKEKNIWNSFSMYTFTGRYDFTDEQSLISCIEEAIEDVIKNTKLVGIHEDVEDTLESIVRIIDDLGTDIDDLDRLKMDTYTPNSWSKSSFTTIKNELNELYCRVQTEWNSKLEINGFNKFYKCTKISKPFVWYTI